MTVFRWTIVLAFAGALVGLFSLGATASTSVQAPAVVADHLNNPRHLAVTPEGVLYIAEAGRAGPKCLDKKQENCIGFSSSITRVEPGKKPVRVITGLISGGGRDGSFTGGADGIGVGPDKVVYVAMTDTPECTSKKGLPARARSQLGHLLRGNRPVADLSSIECKTNPDRTDRNSNPYAVLALGGGHVIVADAGGNDILDVQGSKVKVLALIPKNGKAQSVPTSIAAGPDGAYYIGELAEGAGAGKARVFRLVPGGKPTVYARGFTAITGLTFGPDGSLYVTEFTRNIKKFTPAGDVVRVAPDGKRTRIGVGQLFFPTGAAVDAGGALYVSNWSILPGTAPKGGPFKGKRGQVVKFAVPTG